MKNHLLLFALLCLIIFGCSKQSQTDQIPPTPQEQTQLHSKDPMKGQNHILPGIDQYRLLVKFKAETVADVDKGKPVFTAHKSVNSAFFDDSRKRINSFSYEQAISLKDPAFATAKANANSILSAFAGAFRGLLYVKEAPSMTPEKVLALANEFEQLDIVEYAAMEPVTPPPPPATPDFTSYQTYKLDVDNSAPGIRGINIQYAWSIGVTGQGIKIADIEWGYNKNHEDLVTTTCVEILPPPDDQYKDHGTAVAGVLMSKNNTFGMTGMVYGADACYIVSERNQGRPNGIAAGLAKLGAGDVFLYEMQTGGQNGQYVPADFNQAVWDMTKKATDLGVIVVAAAGNGNQNLDDAYYASYRARGDNGAITVGAGTKVNRNKASFSTYGSTVHVQGWGDWSVASTGYTSLYNGGANAGYTRDFSGTSSATPIVASAVVAIQSWYKARTGKVIAPRTMRAVLIRTGIPQGTGGHIGPLPNIKAAIEDLTRTPPGN